MINFMKPAFNITKENQEIIIRVNQDLLTEEELTKFLDYLTLAQKRKSSELTVEQAENLADDLEQSKSNLLANTDDYETPTEIVIEGIYQGLYQAFTGDTIPLAQMWEDINAE